ncbi:hypothetical protein K435DRAFT_472040 [Dendrothele bispora CBS 962.96]|uniref:PWWP domain-containing protein n=1 Tax=Dendrothele bispora (strain CBS 962.96) TaxID=1314807 RepID=A0A4S8KZY7_DENBC|nr:hypothetical protein K435DRAFT_472040 [Dendrothele bispora CBS 962.96]
MSTRRAAKQSSAPEVNSSAKPPSDDEMLFGETLRKKGSTPIKYGGRKRTSGGVSPRAGSTRATEPRSLHVPRKRTLDLDSSSASDEDEDLPLSPLSSLPPTPSPKREKATAKSLSRVSTSTSGLSFSLTEKPWSLGELGDYVWILVNFKGRPFDPKTKGDNVVEEYIWWPAKVTSFSPQSVKATIYGSLNPSSKTMSLNIKNPSPDNVLSFLDYLGRPRFEEPSFRFPEAEPTPPRKKRKHGEALKERWQQAVSAAIHEKQEHEYDGLPPVGLALSTGSLLASASIPSLSPKRKGKAKAGKGPLPDGVPEDGDGDKHTLKRDESPAADDGLDIPGERVLCRDRESSLAAYWPARIQEFLVVEKRKGKRNVREGLYKVLFLDGTSKDVPRDWFYADYQDEFATCLVGEFQSEFVEDPDDEDSDNDEPEVSSESTTRLESPTPQPLNPDIDFVNLNIHQQFCYTKPILQAILNERYPPVKPRHDQFMKGGSARKGLSNEAGLRGKMDPKDVAAIGKCLKRWCLRDLDSRKNQQQLQDSADAPQESKSNALTDSPMATDSCTDDTEQFTKNTPVNGDSTKVCMTTRAAIMFLAHVFQDATDIHSPTPTQLPSSPAPLPSDSSLATTPKPSFQQDGPTDRRISTVTDEGINTPRQKGCPAYEALSTLEKIGYCTDVLLPVAVLQILLWRNGDRTSIELLSDNEEKELHELGSKLVKETDWVFDIMRMRSMHEKRLAKAQTKQVEGSSSLRLKRSVRSLRRG